MTEPKNGVSRLFRFLRLLCHPQSPLRGVNGPLFITDPDKLKSSEINQTMPIDPVTPCEFLLDLVPHIRPLLPDSCTWFEEGAIEVVGEFPASAGRVADVWVGMVGDRKVAIKSYRCCSSSDYLPNYVASRTCLWRVSHRLKVYIDRGSTKKHSHVVVSDTRMSCRSSEYTLFPNTRWPSFSSSWIISTFESICRTIGVPGGVNLYVSVFMSAAHHSNVSRLAIGNSARC